MNYNRTSKPATTRSGLHGRDDPAPASINAGPGQGSFTNDPTPSFGFSSTEDGSTFECRFDGQRYFPCSSPYTPGTPLSDGTHTFFVKAIDAAGNESGSVSRRFTVDTTAPAVTISSGPANGSTSSDPSPSFSFDSNESGASFGCQLDSGGFDPCSSPYAASGLAGGQHSFQVRATIGPETSARLTHQDLEARPCNHLRPRLGARSPTTAPRASPSPPLTRRRFSCQIDGGVVDADCTSPFTSPVLPDGDHTFTVQQGGDTASRAVHRRHRPPRGDDVVRPGGRLGHQ